tara:strand:+ start:620 stop:1141 length:522 start_codon:yes stop_codon:yes gene_type:complete
MDNKRLYNNKNSLDSSYTSGDEYILENGVPYIGYYHVMDDGTPMSGKSHGEGEDIVLIPIDQKISFKKKSYTKTGYEKFIDNSFKQLGVKPPTETLADQPSINDFFELYNDLFYDIPETGATNSHEYLIKTSTEYIEFDQNNEEIQILQKEIGQLREELLDSQRQIVELQTRI